MTTYPIKDERGSVFAFEIENIYVANRTIARLLRSVPGVSVVEVRKTFAASKDVHVAFRFAGERFIVWEPYGDNSRYWIGPDDDSRRPIVDLQTIEQAFKRYAVPKPLQLLGDLITLKLFRFHKGR